MAGAERFEPRESFGGVGGIHPDEEAAIRGGRGREPQAPHSFEEISFVLVE